MRPDPKQPLQIPVYPGKFPTGPVDHEVAKLQPKRSTDLNRSRTGILLIFIGLIFLPLPAFALYAGLAVIVGAIFMFVGRRSLGPRHQRYASLSFILVVVGQVVAGLGAFGATLFFFIAVSQNPTLAADALSSYFLLLYAIIVVSDVITNVGLVLFTYDMQDARGRTFLWSGFTLQILIEVIVATLVVLQVQATAQQVLSQYPTLREAFSALQATFAPLRLLLWIPAIPYALAYYRARSRIDQLAVGHARAANEPSGMGSSTDHPLL